MTNQEVQTSSNEGVVPSARPVSDPEYDAYIQRVSKDIEANPPLPGMTTAIGMAIITIVVIVTTSLIVVSAIIPGS